MPVIQELVSHDETFKYLSQEPIIVNDLVKTSKDERDYIENLIRMKFSNDMLSTIPQCQCGHLKGEYVIDERCPRCHDIVKAITSENLEPVLWIRKPKGIHKLISPIIWTMMEERFSNKSKFSILRWIIDTTYKPPQGGTKHQEIIQEAQSLGIERGFNNFTMHFEDYVKKLFSMKKLAKQTRAKRLSTDALYNLIFNNMDKVLCDHLPLPNKALLIIGQNNLGLWIDPIIVEVIDAISMMVSIDQDEDITDKQRENRTAKSLIRLASFYMKAEKENVSAKAGVFRKHIFGCRSYFSGRAVISSLTSSHHYDEVEIPWSIGITILRPMIINKLLRRGYDLNKAIGFIHSNVDKYDPLLHSIVNELIQESRDKRMYCIVHRNPTLLQGSAQRFWFDHIKTDPRDPTIGFSILSVKAPNADAESDFTI